MLFDAAVFAYNEENRICRGLDGLLANVPAGSVLRVFVLVNGCRDRTAAVVRGYSREHPEVVPVEIAFGDKCNA